ncbi:MAG: heterodisulfide reductase-related iron-sulfur binding cluster [Anaerolineales bacterium]|nr:heterodisulfide reductase-related iron-sulfur binding cluster [Anaerolineales bacterium]
MTTTEKRIEKPWSRIGDVLLYALGQVRTLKKLYPGFMHLLIFWGVIIQVVGTLIKIMQMGLFVPFTWPLFSQAVYFGYELIMDLAGAAILLGVILALIRRWVIKPAFMQNSWDDTYALLLLALIPIAGFITEGLRLFSTRPVWASWAPIGNFVAGLFQISAITTTQADLIHPYLFWVHVGLGLFLTASIPFTKLRHIIYTPIHIFLKTRRPAGELNSISDIMNAEVLGASTISEFSSLDLLAFDACLQCGRCEEVCPATNSGLAYSPRTLLLMLRENMAEVLLAPQIGANQNLQPELLQEEFLWSCTTCGHCLDVCPAFIRPPEQVIDLRRAQVLMTGDVPQTVGETLRNFERQGNPWGMPAQNRMGWAEGLDLRVVSPGDEMDVLYYVGCAGAFDDRNKKVARAFIEILNKMNIDYGILGDAEKCCGETTRRMGNEYLFQVAAEENINLFSEIKFNKIVTLCPHGFNTFKNEYPKFGGNFQVQHAVEFLTDLLADHKYKLSTGQDFGKLTFHDSCYLGRYNQIYSQPRELLRQVNLPPEEMKAAREESFCCGGGGGAMWLETSADTRINQHRLQQALDIKADTITTACPYCLIMFDDALRSKGLAEQIRVFDLVEILNQSL